MKLSKFTSLKISPLVDIPLIKGGDDIVGIIIQSLAKSAIRLKDGDILVIAQKIISKTEKRMVDLKTISPSKEALDLAKETDKDARLVELILRESSEVLRKRPGLIIVEHKLGFVCANAGIDHSNVESEGNNLEDRVLMLPEDPDNSCKEIREGIKTKTGIDVGVMIIDSHGRSWRLGTVGVAIGISGLPGVADLRGESDLFGYKLQVTEVGVADELAAAASLMMGQVAEGTPVMHIRGFPYELRESSLNELIRPLDKDLFR